METGHYVWVHVVSVEPSCLQEVLSLKCLSEFSNFLSVASQNVVVVEKEDLILWKRYISALPLKCGSVLIKKNSF